MPCSPATAATETPGLRQVAKSVALNSGEYLRWVRRVEYLWLSEVLSIVSTIKFVDTILQDNDANLNMTLLDAYFDSGLLLVRICLSMRLVPLQLASQLDEVIDESVQTCHSDSSRYHPREAAR